MSEEIYNDLMQRLDIIAEKLETTGALLFKQAMYWNYAYAAMDILFWLIAAAGTWLSWTRKITEDDYNGYEPTERVYVIWVFRCISIIALIGATLANLPDAAFRLCAPMLGALKLLLTSVF